MSLLQIRKKDQEQNGVDVEVFPLRHNHVLACSSGCDITNFNQRINSRISDYTRSIPNYFFPFAGLTEKELALYVGPWLDLLILDHMEMDQRVFSSNCFRISILFSLPKTSISQ